MEKLIIFKNTLGKDREIQKEINNRYNKIVRWQEDVFD
jgi:hypothetical protein